jgi:DNA-binding NarL/FixJ family response regulator
MRASLNDMCALPSSVARQIAFSLPVESDTGLTGEELTWLRRLADGSTVEQVADDAGFSERSMYRRMAAAYRKVGAETRTEAMVRLAQLGLLRD